MDNDAPMDGAALISAMKQYGSPTADGEDTDIDGELICVEEFNRYIMEFFR